MPKQKRTWPSALVALLVITLTVGLLPARAQVATNDTTITVTGGGWGHGVGMSQYGAYGRASAGDTHEEILSFYYPGSVLTELDATDDLRIHLHSARGTRVLPSQDPEHSGDIEIVDGEGNRIYNSRNGRELTVRKVDGGFRVMRPTNSGGNRNLCIDDDDVDRCQVDEIRLRFVQGEPIEVNGIDRVSVGTSGNSYRWGELAIYDRTFDDTDRTLWVVLEELGMDQYLYGLAEVPKSWPAEVLKSQVVAARTYAFDRATSRRANPGRDVPWDLFSTVDDQVYYGYGNETGTYGPVWLEAVDDTSGNVLLYDGEPITAFYSSSNGGWTEESGYVFVTSLPYLTANRDRHDDFRNPYASWSRDYTGDELGAWLASSSIGGVGSVVDVQITGNIGRSGRVDKATVEITGTEGTVTTTGNRFRIAVNAGVARAGGGLSRQLLSTKFAVTTLGGAEPVGAVDRVKRRQTGNVRIAGWVFDPDIDASVNVEIRVDDEAIHTVLADQSRFDIDAVFGEGTSRGFDVVLPIDNTVAHQVCVYADNIGPGGQMLLGCQVV